MNYTGGELPVFQVSVEISHFPIPDIPRPAKRGPGKVAVVKKEKVTQQPTKTKHNPEMISVQNDWESYQKIMFDIHHSQLKRQCSYFQND